VNRSKSIEHLLRDLNRCRWWPIEAFPRDCKGFKKPSFIDPALIRRSGGAVQSKLVLGKCEAIHDSQQDSLSPVRIIRHSQDSVARVNSRNVAPRPGTVMVPGRKVAA